MNESFGIATSSMLVELSISCWTARKLDKQVSAEIDESKNTKVRGGNYHKQLLAGCPALDAVTRYAANVRLWHTKNTLPWSDHGSRLITTEHFINYKTELGQHEANFNKLVENFIQTYPTMISAAAFQLGALFNRLEYPEVEAITNKFQFRYSFSPVPTAGDFRIDIAEQAKAELITQYEAAFKQRMDSAMREIWDRLHDCLSHMSDRLSDNDEGERKSFHSTMITNASELLSVLGHLNITKDPKLEQARRELSEVLLHTDAAAIKESDHVRHSVKDKVDSIISKFDW
jgi:hypothetical protein